MSYDGSSFFGWQRTKEGPNVESHLEQALQTILQHPVSLDAISRTDRGVHAEGQIVRFTLETEMALPLLQHRLNCLLPKTIRVTDIALGFTEPIKKEYHYFVDTRPFQPPHERFYVWHYPYSLDLCAMQTKAATLVGEKDFYDLQNRGRFHATTVRRLESVSITGDGFYHFTLIGNSFLYKMVRNIVGLLVYAGRGKTPHGRYTAPAHGLTLKRIYTL